MAEAFKALLPGLEVVDRTALLRGLRRVAKLAAAAAALCATPSFAQTAAPPAGPPPPADGAAPETPAQTWAYHVQSTLVDQAALPFRSPYAGPQSLTPSEDRETFDATLYVGFRPWRSAEVWADPEIDQGFGLADTLGVAGFPSGEAYKVGAAAPYLKLPRWFLRQTIDLGGEREKVDADQTQLAGSRTADRLVLWLGKFSVVDVFDANAYAHDPRGDFMNWALIDTGTFDYAANAWGFTYGAAAEWYEGRWTLRGGVFDLSIVPNSVTLDPTFRQDQYIAELEERHTLVGRKGRLLVTTFLTRGRMGSFADAIAQSEETGRAPNTADVRRYQGRAGVSLDVEQSLTDDLGLFLRAGVADGDTEPYEFADIDRTLSGGLSTSGARWGRKDDTVGLAGIINGISKIHEEYLADGGLGILVGDGKLPHPGPEEIVETYYQFAITPHWALSLDGQLVANPAYNRDRGPAPIIGFRIHAQL